MKVLHGVWIAVKALLWALVIGVPTIGVWVASSLAAFLNGPIWLACLAGLLLFPLLPLGWDAWATRRFLRKQDARTAAGKPPRERIVLFWDRMIIRTFAVNVAFLAALLATFPRAGFTALATRGDWFLDGAVGRELPRASEALRPVLFKSAEGLTWLYEWYRDNPYEQFQTDEPVPVPDAAEFGEVETRPVPPGPVLVTDVPDAPQPAPAPTPIPELTPEPRVAGEPPAWPMPAELHPVVRDMPEAVKTDYGAVATYIKQNEPDPFLRVKALHDFVADRIAYDVDALRSGQYPPAEPKVVFDRKLAVCAGYARLLEAMGKVTGDEIVYVTGDSRDQNGGIAGGGHAWNAAKIEGKWYLIDPTWNAGFVNDGAPFEKRYRTNYLFTPPAIFGVDHFPDEDAWQLRPDPITRGEFVRQPMMESEFWVQGLELIAPERSQVEAHRGEVAITLKNPRGAKIIGRVPANGRDYFCDVAGTTQVSVRCRVPHGTHELKLFAGPPTLETFPFVGRFEVTSR